MKKLYYLIILTVILGLVLTGCFLSNVGQVPTTGQSGIAYLTKGTLAPNNLVGLWHFDGDADDSSDYGNDGTVNGAGWVGGKFGEALSFDGNDSVVIPDSASLSITGELTIEVWANETSRGTYSKIVSRRSGTYFYFLGVANGKPYGGIGDGSTSTVTTQTVEMPLNEWHHLAFVYNEADDKMYLYYDGELTETVTVIQSLPAQIGVDLSIGADREGTANFFTGLIDEVRIWNVALTATQILQSYEALHVDDDWAEWPGAYYTITEALAVAGDGDTIIVHEGTYDGFKVSVKTDLTIMGIGNPVVSGGTVGVGTDTALIGVEDSENITIEGLTVDATGIVATPFAAILYTGSTGTIQDNTIQNIGDLGQDAGAIRVDGGGSIAILDNTISEFNKSGIMVGDVLSVQIEGNIISTTNYNLAPNGIQVGYVMDPTATTGTVNNNQVSGCHWSGYNLEEYELTWTGSGILVIAPNSTLEISGNEVQSCDVGLDIEAGTETLITTLITNNNVHDNSYGFVLWNANPIINCNNIYQNTLAGVYRTSEGDLEGILDATQNWWGHATGPFHPSNSGGIGDAVSDNVDYSNWAYIPDFCDCEAKTIGYWKNHPEYVEGILIELDYSIEVGTTKIVNEAIATDIFTKPHSKTYSMLAAQLLAAKLNVAQLSQFIPGYNSGCVDAAIVEADDILEVYGYTETVAKVDKAKVNDVKDVLDDFNNYGCDGNDCPCICD